MTNSRGTYSTSFFCLVRTGIDHFPADRADPSQTDSKCESAFGRKNDCADFFRILKKKSAQSITSPFLLLVILRTSPKSAGTIYSLAGRREKRSG
jgi:hypothetical protein